MISTLHTQNIDLNNFEYINAEYEYSILPAVIFYLFGWKHFKIKSLLIYLNIWGYKYEKAFPK